MTSRPSWAKRKPTKQLVPTDPETVKLAKQIASAYRLLLKHHQPYSNPWAASTPIEQTQFWTSFLKAAVVVKDLDARPFEFMQAQWYGILKIAKKSCDRMLYPQMLSTEWARLRYAAFTGKQVAQAARVVKPSQLTTVGLFSREERRLSKLVAGYGGLSELEVLAIHYVEFSRDFLKSKNCWEDVAEQYEAALAG